MNPNRAVQNGRTLLHNVAQSGTPEMVTMLLDHGAEIDARTPDGRTPLVFAVRAGKNLNADVLRLRGASTRGVRPLDELIGAAVRVLDVIASQYGHTFNFQERLMGGCSIDKYGSSLTDETLADAQASDSVLLGAVGGPKWDDPNAKDRPERGLLALRKGLGVFANLRPVKVHPALIDASPLKPEKLKGVDIIVVRELTGGLYFGQPKLREMKDGKERAVDTLEYFDYEIKREIGRAHV